MKPTSNIYLTALYVHHVTHKHEFTGGNLVNERYNAYEWLRAFIPPHVWEDRAAILVKHGWPDPDDAWQVMSAERWDDRPHPCCHTKPDMTREIDALLEPYTLINYEHIGYQPGYVYSQTHTAMRRGQFELLSISGPARVYRINPAYVEHPAF